MIFRARAFKNEVVVFINHRNYNPEIISPGINITRVPANTNSTAKQYRSIFFTFFCLVVQKQQKDNFFVIIPEPVKVNTG